MSASFYYVPNGAPFLPSLVAYTATENRLENVKIVLPYDLAAHEFIKAWKTLGKTGLMPELIIMGKNAEKKPEEQKAFLWQQKYILWALISKAFYDWPKVQQSDLIQEIKNLDDSLRHHLVPIEKFRSYMKDQHISDFSQKITEIIVVYRQLEKSWGLINPIDQRLESINHLLDKIKNKKITIGLLLELQLLYLMFKNS